MSPRAVVISCEHGGADVPATYRPLFKGQAKLLASHRGHDPGALTLARQFARATQASFFYSTVTRLLVELNRSQHHPALFSAITRTLPKAEKERILAEHYLPYRQAITETIETAVGRGETILHLSVHTFTPVLDGETRRADVGILYDPARPLESQFARHWQALLRSARPTEAIRRNHPYLGTADGLVTELRRRFPKNRYVGLELEVNQKWPRGPLADWRRLSQALIDTFRRAASDRAI